MYYEVKATKEDIKNAIQHMEALRNSIEDMVIDYTTNCKEYGTEAFVELLTEEYEKEVARLEEIANAIDEINDRYGDYSEELSTRI